MRLATELADASIFTVPPEKLTWLPAVPRGAVFIPVGPNLPFPKVQVTASSNRIPTVGVFSITGGQPGASETKDIILAVRQAAKQVGRMRLSVFGRHAELREVELHKGLEGVPVEISVEGVAPPERIVNHLAACDVLLFVRRGISTRRGSGIAGLAAGLPIVAYENSETAPPITDAGVVLVNESQPEEAGNALARILCDPDLRMELSARSRAVYEAHFAWPAIAQRYASLLKRP
jgi:glycosyltransferase involved in cell wall biosynthesis